MTWKRDEVEGEIVATPAQQERFAIDKNFDAVRSEPRNVDYLVPLANAEAEECARAFADMAYSVIADDYNGFASQDDSDRCFEQCLTNARKYACEREYAELICPGWDDEDD
jgi:hypothetical protein